MTPRDARILAQHLHAGQTDKAGRPYVEAHLDDVVSRLGANATNDERVVGYLHDTIEDCEITPEGLTVAGVPPHCVGAIELLTKTKANRPYLDEISDIEVRGNYPAPTRIMAVRVKRADNLSNLAPERVSLLSPNQQLLHAKHLAPRYRASLTLLDEMETRLLASCSLPI